jgi:hypothetical protein
MMLLRYSGSPKGVKKYQYINPDVMHLPGIQDNGPYKVPETRGPAFFNTDLNITRDFHVSEKDIVSLRLAAFNFINRANPTFSSLNPNNYTVNYTYTAPTAGNVSDLLYAAPQDQSGFGSTTLANGAPQKAGRRVLEVSIKYVF